jgi:hypothetical protein
MSDFMILKRFKVSIYPPRAPIIKEVIWKPPLANWTKCNTDGTYTNTNAACGGIFRNHSADFLGCFAEPVGRISSFFSEFCGVLRAIEIADQLNWSNLWVETDSSLTVLAFKDDTA